MPTLRELERNGDLARFGGNRKRQKSPTRFFYWQSHSIQNYKEKSKTRWRASDEAIKLCNESKEGKGLVTLEYARTLFDTFRILSGDGREIDLDGAAKIIAE